MADDIDDWQPTTSAGVDDWQPITQTTAPTEVDDWQAAVAPPVQQEASLSDITQRVKQLPPFGQQPEPAPNRRGIVERTTTGFKGAYEPILSDAVKKVAPGFAEQHPTAAGVIQAGIEASPVSWVDKTLAAVMGAQGAAAGAATGAVEQSGGLNRAEADRLQRDLTILATKAPFEAGMGLAGATIPGRAAQLGDVGKVGFKELQQHGTPGSEAAVGTVQEAKPTAVPAPTEYTPVRAAKPGPEDYGKKPVPSEPGEAGVNIGPDPALQHAIDAATETVKPTAEVPPAAAAPTAPAPAAAGPGEPPLEPGMTRLYRGDTALPPDAPVPDWLKGTPEHQATVDASGRWFTADRAIADYYNQTFGDKSRRVSYVDVPAAEADRFLASNQPEAARFSAEGRAPEEHFVPRATAERAQPLTPREAIAQRAPGETVGDALRQPVSESELGPEGTPAPMGAAATPAAALPAPLPRPPLRERIMDTLRTGYDKFLDFGGRAVEEAQMKFAPMAARSATRDARAIAKTQADTIRRIDYELSVVDNHIVKNFDQESRKAMWDRADEENVMRQRGETSEHMGIATLEPHERALVESFQPKARELWDMARDIGWVHGEGLPYYTPRMFEGIMEKVEGASALDAKGRNIQTTTPQMKQRKYQSAEESEAAAKAKFGEEAKIARDIRTMPLALAKMEKALTNRMMIKKIEDVGRHIGQQTMIESATKPGPGWFTLPDNPAFYTFRPRMEIADTPVYRAAAEQRSGVPVPEAKIPLLDRNGNPVIDRVPIWIPDQFRGPLKAIMSEPSGLIYNGFMALKGKTMGLIMNSPMIHNAVEWGRALPTMPGKMITFQTYFEGNAAKRGVPYDGTIRYVRDWATGKLEAAPRNASPTMMEAIDTGLVPIGKRFFNQDISAIMEQPNLTPGRSLTAKTLALVPDLYDPKAGEAVKRAVDRAGDFWHNTLLWDRIGDLQMGLYVNAKRDLMQHNGLEPRMASYVASHVANRYAGALPQEAMSNGARKIANFLMFSRTFTLGNLGVLKDMVTGLPRDVQAKMMQEFGYVDPQGISYVKSLARRKAMMAVGLDVGLMYVGNSILQSAFNLLQDDNTLGKEGAEYVRRFNDAIQRVSEGNPLALLNPITLLGTVGSLSATYENEPGKQDRIMVGKTKDGRAIYMRNPVGKIGEEFVGYLSGPLDMLKRKMGTIARPAWQILANDKGFGEKIYDPHADMLSGTQMESAINIGKTLFLAQTPEGQISAAIDLAKGETAQKVGRVPVAALQAFGPLAGVTFSQGHPGGPAAGEAARLHEQEQFRLGPELKELRKMVREGKTDEAVDRMDKMELPSGLRKSILNPHMTPRTIREMTRSGTPEQQRRFERARETPEVNDWVPAQ